MVGFVEELEAFLESTVGDALRVVRVVSPADEDHDSWYRNEHVTMRDDVAAMYEDERDACIGREVLHQLWETDYQAELFELGDVRYSMYGFDQAFVIMVFEDTDRATVVSVDQDADVEVREFADHVCGLIQEAA